MNKMCDVCGKDFVASGSAKRCSTACIKKGRTIYIAAYKKARRKELATKQRQYYANNTGKIAEYRQQNKEKRATQSREYYEANKRVLQHKARVRSAARRNDLQIVASAVKSSARYRHNILVPDVLAEATAIVRLIKRNLKA